MVAMTLLPTTGAGLPSKKSPRFTFAPCGITASPQMLRSIPLARDRLKLLALYFGCCLFLSAAFTIRYQAVCERPELGSAEPSCRNASLGTWNFTSMQIDGDSLPPASRVVSSYILDSTTSSVWVQVALAFNLHGSEVPG